MATKTFYGLGNATAGTCTTSNANCSGRSAAYSGKTATTTDQTGPAVNTTIALTSSATNLIFGNGVTNSDAGAGLIECSPDVATWAAGTYGVTVEVTTANMNISLEEIYLCRRDSSCGAVSTIGSLTGIARGLGSTGSVTHNVTGSADTHGSTDLLEVILIGSNSAMSTQTAVVKVTIATPIDSAPATSSPPWYGTHRPQFRTPKRRII